MQKLLAVLLLVALEAWSSGEKQKHIFFLEKKKNTTKKPKNKINKQQKKNKKNTQKTKLRLTEGWMFVKTVTTSNVGVNLTQKSLLFVHKN